MCRKVFVKYTELGSRKGYFVFSSKELKFCMKYIYIRYIYRYAIYPKFLLWFPTFWALDFPTSRSETYL